MSKDQLLTINDIEFEHSREPLGISFPNPRLSWTVSTNIPDWKQSAYELECATRSDGSPRCTGKVRSGESVLNAWPFEPLKSRERAFVRVRVWGNSDLTPSDWSAYAAVEAGLLETACWKARFISPAILPKTGEKPLPGLLLRRNFKVRPGLCKARLYTSAHGIYSAQLNGQPVNDQLFSPGWTSYPHRLRYQTTDVGPLLQEGVNTLGAILGEGWYLGRLGYNGGRPCIYGDRMAFLAQLELEYSDGQIDTVLTDESWRSVAGPILSSGIYDGEEYDARLELPGWSSPAFEDGEWAGVVSVDRDLGTLIAPCGPPVRRTETVHPIGILRSPSGRTIVDFGQNLVGRVQISVKGNAGQTIIFRHAEVLEHGELCTRPLRFAAATDRYTLKGGGLELWEPIFTFHGFRYCEVEGWPGELKPENIVAAVCHSDLERTGWFECSDPMINQLYSNIVWSMRGNFLDIPTDCPQRDERLGWTADIQIFSPTACFLYDCAGFLSSWLSDLAMEQRSDGAVPYFIPNINTGPIVPSGAWGDASVIVPWVLYRAFGDPGILAVQFDSMRAWVDHVATLAGDSLVWERGFQFGDWLDPNAPPERPGDARTDSSLIATAYLAKSAQLVGLAAGVLGRIEEAERYAGLSARVRAAFLREFVSANGRLVSDSVTAYSLALEFGLLSSSPQRARAGQTLSRLVREQGYRISTGFIGTPLVCDALCSVGDHEAAFRLLTQRSCPSWLYPVTMGATSSWERWNSMLPDGTVNSGDTTSFNHYALGAIADWLHRSIGGLAPLDAGYQTMEIKPIIGGGLEYACSRLKTPYGLAECRWKLSQGMVEMKVSVPPNARARVTLPRSGKAAFELGSGTYSWSYRAEPETVRPITLDSSLSEYFADPGLVRIVVERIPELACLATITQISSATTLAQQLDFLPDGERLKQPLAQALAAIQQNQADSSGYGY